MVRRSHRDGLGSASQAPRDRASGTNGATDVPVVGQWCGTQGPGPGPVKAWPVMAWGGVWVCSVTLTWFLLVWEETQEPGLRVTTCSGGLSATAFPRFHKWAGGVLLGNPPLPGERGGRKWSRDARYTTLLLLRPRDWGNCSFIEVLGTAGCWASGGTKTKWNKGFSTRPSFGGGSGAVTISRRAVPSISGSPVSGPLALALAAGSGGGLDGLGVLSVTGSTTPHGGRLLPRRGSGGGHRGAPTATSRLRGCSRSGSSSGFPPAHDVLNRLSLLLCCRKLLGTALDSVAEKAGLWHGSIQELYLLLLLHVSETQPEMALLDHKRGHRTTQRLCGHLRRSERKVRRSTQLM